MKRPWIIRQVSDEGSSTPFVARLWVGLFELRDQILPHRFGTPNGEARRKDFDALYEPVRLSLTTARKAGHRIGELVSDHRKKVQEGSILRIDKTAVHISETIDGALHDQFATFLNSSSRAFRGVQDVVHFFGIDIGFLYANDANFNEGIERLRGARNDTLAEFLISTRKQWSATFTQRRISLEHEGWTLPNIEHNVMADRKIDIREPEIDGKPVSLYVRDVFNALASFIENIVVYSFQAALKPDLGIFEIPAAKRDPNYCKRFEVWHPIMGTQKWTLYYCEDDLF